MAKTKSTKSTRSPKASTPTKPKQAGVRKSKRSAPKTAKATAPPPAESAEPKRKQVSAACLNCRTRKIKCDGQRPCSHCTKKDPSNCLYDVEEGETREGALKRRNADLSARVAELERQNNEFRAVWIVMRQMARQWYEWGDLRWILRREETFEEFLEEVFEADIYYDLAV
ncbi:hypothetical protein K469DRAFT_708909 [Zopfia rhizophila CBS 207.26]|uniref:Zn(2)-C6 fungal-type domain-containing protein n=1 Tax=Zopfia rhizophila CBS 207.26 TaxID=1314779 RepID=A0A6A6E135_9PEZI|nr:hypothetical protein K469DRAFT_708909 [Zopfia rhizophila CBS 207.26]